MSMYKSRYDVGVKTIDHKGKKITTSINTDFMDNIETTIMKQNHKIGTIKQYIAHRPDAISDIFYNTAANWWYVLLYNNLDDPIQNLNPGDPFLVPFIDDVLKK
jgi:hypothetical protein